MTDINVCGGGGVSENINTDTPPQAGNGCLKVENVKRKLHGEDGRLNFSKNHLRRLISRNLPDGKTSSEEAVKTLSGLLESEVGKVIYLGMSGKPHTRLTPADLEDGFKRYVALRFFRENKIGMRRLVSMSEQAQEFILSLKATYGSIITAEEKENGE